MKVIHLKSLTDYELMTRINQSDERAFQILYTRYWKSLFSYAFCLIENRSIASDIVQDIWTSFWERRRKIDNDNIKGYLYTSVRYRVYKEIRDNRTLKTQLETLSDLITTNNTDEVIDYLDTSRTLNNCINNLPPRSKEVFSLSRFDGLSNQEISEKLRISKRTVETHISNSLKQLKRNISLL